jgi:hypothetical protein
MPLGRPTHEDNITMVPEETRCEFVGWIHLVRSRFQHSSSCEQDMLLQFPYKVGNFMTLWAAILARRALPTEIISPIKFIFVRRMFSALHWCFFFIPGLWGYWHCGHSWPIVAASGDSEDDCGEADGMLAASLWSTWVSQTKPVKLR